MKFVKYPGNDIEVVSVAEGVLRRPAMYLGKKSLYGLTCFLTALLCAKSDFFFKDSGFVFESWVRKLTDNQGRSFEIALKLAGGDDEKGFDVWADWYRRYKTCTDMEISE